MKSGNTFTILSAHWREFPYQNSILLINIFWIHCLSCQSQECNDVFWPFLLLDFVEKICLCFMFCNVGTLSSGLIQVDFEYQDMEEHVWWYDRALHEMYADQKDRTHKRTSHWWPCGVMVTLFDWPCFWLLPYYTELSRSTVICIYQLIPRLHKAGFLLRVCVQRQTK